MAAGVVRRRAGGRAAADRRSPSGAAAARRSRRRLSRALVEWPLPVEDTRGYTYAEVTAGGVALGEIDPSTMESRICPGLFLVGEVLDVDGRIGGFNFQWAWASARAAARGLTSATDSLTASACFGLGGLRLPSAPSASFGSFGSFGLRLGRALASRLVRRRLVRRLQRDEPVAKVRRPCSSKSITVWCSFTSTSVPGP